MNLVKRCIAHERKGFFENKLAQINLRILLSHLLSEPTIIIIGCFSTGLETLTSVLTMPCVL